MTIQYRPVGVCSQLMKIEVEGGLVQGLEAEGGCNGNLQGLARLVRGMPVKEVIARLEGIRCGRKQTSCPDQLAQALKTLPD